jgi:enolase
VSLYKHIADLSGKSSSVIPVPAITVINGGKHAANNLAVQVCCNQVAFSQILFFIQLKTYVSLFPKE